MSASDEHDCKVALNTRANVLHGFTGYHLRCAWQVVQADLMQVLKSLDLRLATYSTLLLIAETPDQRQSTLADTLGIERPNFVAIVEELERRGLITRTRDLDDRRAYCLNATTEGLALADQAVKACQAHEEKLFGQLSAEDRAQLDRILRQFRTFESGR